MEEGKGWIWKDKLKITGRIPDVLAHICKPRSWFKAYLDYRVRLWLKDKQTNKQTQERGKKKRRRNRKKEEREKKKEKKIQFITCINSG